MKQKSKITVLISPLDWGLGHATRLIPIITHFLQADCKVIIATDGAQESLLKLEFPNLTFVTLPGYNISYAKHKRNFAVKIVWQLPKILKAIQQEKIWLKNFVRHTPVDIVIADNRYGLYHTKLTSVFITHQLTIKAPFSLVQRLIQKWHYKFIEKYSLCWVPDERGPSNLSGILGHPKVLPHLPVTYLGGISRFQKKTGTQYKYNLLIIISGPEPQRTLFEEKIWEQLQSYMGDALLIRGLPGTRNKIAALPNIVVENHLPATQLAAAFAASEYIISRSGYTTVMDICKLSKKSILVPTPGQTEQEYLALHLQQQGWCLSVAQNRFNLTEVLQQARAFPYKMPELPMDAYKEVITDFITQETAGKV